MLGYLPQEFGVYPKYQRVDMLQHLAVMKGITEPGERKEMVEALLHQTNLWDLRKKSLSTYSGGMKQRFGIAQALLGKPRLIIVDEPTAGLDPAERNRFLNLLCSIGSDVTVILSTHIVEDVRELCPRMAIISNGELLLEGAPAGNACRLCRAQYGARLSPRDRAAGARGGSPRYLESFGWWAARDSRLRGQPPGDGFRPVDAGLEDVYFLNLANPPPSKINPKEICAWPSSGSFSCSS